MIKILGLLMANPFIYLLIEIILIDYKWGIESINNFSTMEQVGIILVVVFTPCVISLFIATILDRIIPIKYLKQGEK
jgi:hypothetical protein